MTRQYGKVNGSRRSRGCRDAIETANQAINAGYNEGEVNRLLAQIQTEQDRLNQVYRLVTSATIDEFNDTGVGIARIVPQLEVRQGHTVRNRRRGEATHRISRGQKRFGSAPRGRAGRPGGGHGHHRHGRARAKPACYRQANSTCSASCPTAPRSC